MKSVDFITNIAPHYRERLWLELLELEGYRVTFFFGVEKRSSIRGIDFRGDQWRAYLERLVRLTNVRIRHVLVWQTRVVLNAIRTNSQITIILGDMYVVSNWIALLILRLRGRRVVFWGHGLYGREGRVRKFLRLLFLRRADINLVYGKRAKKLLIDNGFIENNVRVIYNSLDYPLQTSLRSYAIDRDFYRRTEWFRRSNLPVLIYVGRLINNKRLDELIDIVNALNARANRFNLLIVGDGPERPFLESLVGHEDGAIHFYGACYQENKLAKLLANADLCISPGEIGLSAIHAMSYGTPACTHGDYSRQGPEVEAISEGVTGTLFDGTNDDLQQKIEDWFASTRNREEVRAACYRVIDQKYNPQVQCQILQEALGSL